MGNFGIDMCSFAMKALGPMSSLVMQMAVLERWSRVPCTKPIEGALRFFERPCFPRELLAASSRETESAFLGFGNFSSCPKALQGWFLRWLRCCRPIEMSLRGY